VLVGSPDVGTGRFRFRKRVRVRMPVRIRLAECSLLPPLREVTGPLPMTSVTFVKNPSRSRVAQHHERERNHHDRYRPALAHPNSCRIVADTATWTADPTSQPTSGTRHAPKRLIVCSDGSSWTDGLNGWVWAKA